MVLFFVSSFVLLGGFFGYTEAQNHNIEDTGGLVNCGKGKTLYQLQTGYEFAVDGQGNPLKDQDGKYRYTNIVSEELRSCDFESAGNLLLKVVNYLMFIVAPTLVIIMISIGGFKILTMGGQNPEARKSGQKMIIYSLIGYVIILSSVLVIDEFINIIGVDENTGLKPTENSEGWRDIDAIFSPTIDGN